MIRIGKIDYKNIYPMYYYFNADELGNQVELIQKVPAALNREMAKGLIDIGPISSFAYALDQQQYTLLPDLSVSAEGKVRSIYLFSHVPITELQGCSIALTSSSATSVALLKVLMKSYYADDVDYTTMTPSYEQMLAQHDAALLIGDDAIQAYFNHDQRTYMYDLGELWYKHTQLPMVFAVWAVRKEIIEREPELVNQIYHMFVDSKKRALSYMHPFISEIEAQFGGDALYWQAYFSGLTYAFEQKQINGLQLFYSMAKDCGILDHIAPIETWNPDIVLRAK